MCYCFFLQLGEERSEPAFTARATTETIALVVYIVTSESTTRAKGEHDTAVEGYIAAKHREASMWT